MLYSDIHINNIMMDPTVFTDIPHPTHHSMSIDFKHSLRTRTRTSHPPRYYYIDFGLSWILSPEDPSPRIVVSVPGDKTIPEFKDPGPGGQHDPYKIDVYCLGNIIREHFMAVSGTLIERRVSLTINAIAEKPEF